MRGAAILRARGWRDGDVPSMATDDLYHVRHYLLWEAGDCYHSVVPRGGLSVPGGAGYDSLLWGELMRRAQVVSAELRYRGVEAAL